MDWSNIVEEYIGYIDDERDRTGAAHITLYGFPYIPENIIVPRIKGKYDDLTHLKYKCYANESPKQGWFPCVDMELMFRKGDFESEYVGCIKDKLSELNDFIVSYNQQFNKNALVIIKNFEE